METKKLLVLALGAMMLCPMVEAMSHVNTDSNASSYTTLKVAKKACLFSMLAGCGIGLWGVGKATWGGCVTLFGSVMGLFGFWKSTAAVGDLVISRQSNGKDSSREKKDLKCVANGATEALDGTVVALTGINTGVSGLRLALKGFGVAVASGVGYLAIDYVDMKSKQ